MADLIQALADGLFNVLLVFETFLDILDNIPFLDSGFSFLELFYAVALLVFIFNLIVDFVNPDKDTVSEEITENIDSNISIGI